MTGRHGSFLVGSLILLGLARYAEPFEPGEAAEQLNQAEVAQCVEGFARLGASSSDNVRLKDMCRAATSPSHPVDAVAAVRGRALYNYHCISCHGREAQGGEGPNLLISPLVGWDKDGELIGKVVRNGVPNTLMRPFSLKADEVADISQYLHSLSSKVTAKDNESLAGDVLKGRRFFAERCAGCHAREQDIAAIGSKYGDPRALQKAWLMPTAPPFATVKMVDGNVVNGPIVQIDEFNITIGMPDGGERTFAKGVQGQVIDVHDPLAGHKALLSVYKDGDIHNITAYLVSLKSAPSRPPTTTQSNIEGLTSMSNKQKEERPMLPPDAILRPTPDSWPTYSGDYSGKRFSSLKQITQTNIKNLGLAWNTRVVAGAADSGPHLYVAGEGNGNVFMSQADIKGSVLEVNGELYISTPDNAWAIDGHDGHVEWHFVWKTKGGSHIGNRGLGMWGNNLYLETPDAYLVSIDARTGREHWHVAIADIERGHAGSQAPVVVGDHVIVGVTGGDMPGSLQSYDARTGKLQWRRYSAPVDLGDPGLRTWKGLNTSRFGGGSVWVPGAYDSETGLYIYGTGDSAGFTSEWRGNGDALFTCSLIAVNVDTGTMAWYYQLTPNDTNDWDAGQTPVLAEISIGGRQRKVAMVAARNGYFFVVDRLTGQHLVTSKFSSAANWAAPHLNANGQPVRLVQKDHYQSGALISPNYIGAANWLPASYDADYGLYYVPTAESWAMHYAVPPELGGKAETNIDSTSYLLAINPTTGRVIWSVHYPTLGPSFGGLLTNGVLTTAGKLLFSGDPAGNLVARDPSNGKPLWHSHLGRVSNAPETYMLDGRQYILVAGGDTVYAFTLDESK